MKQRLMIYFFMLLLALSAAGSVVAAEPNDEDALAGVTEGKALFDIDISDQEASKMALYLSVISATHQGLLDQNVEPDIIIAFRGSSVKLITLDYGTVGAKELEAREAIAYLVSDLRTKGVKFEACALATALFNVDNGNLLPGIKPVGNTFISLTGYQTKGYALIPIR
jgi:intracellular sulfur oxidation DsrE/DsrF family protein